MIYRSSVSVDKYDTPILQNLGLATLAAVWFEDN